MDGSLMSYVGWFIGSDCWCVSWSVDCLVGWRNWLFNSLGWLLFWFIRWFSWLVAQWVDWWFGLFVRWWVTEFCVS